MNRRWTRWGVVGVLSLLSVPVWAQEDAGEDAAVVEDAGHDATVIEDAAAPDTATTPDAAAPDTATTADAAQPDTHTAHDAAGIDTSTAHDAAQPDTATAPDAVTTDSAQPDTAPADTWRPDGWRPDTGPCVAVCVDERVLQACSNDGVQVPLHCPSDYICKDARCVPVEPTDDTDDGCTCAARDGGAAAAVTFVLGAIWLACFRRRRQ